VPKQSQFKNVVAQFIGQLCLMNQATTKCGGEATWTDTLQGNPKLEALNPKQIPISKFKAQFSSYQPSAISHQLPTDCFFIFAFLRLPRFARNDNKKGRNDNKKGWQ